MVKLLTKYGYRLDLKDDDNRTALIHACINQNILTIKFLLENRIDLLEE